MSGEFRVQYTTGATLYVIRHRASDGAWWNVAGGAHEAALTSAWADYATSLPEVGASGWYLGTDPDAGTEGGYTVFLQAGGAPASTDAPIAVGGLNELDALATAASIAGLNDLSAAQVNAEMDAALAEYDGPTKAELDAALAALPAAPSAATVASAVWSAVTRTLTSSGALSEGDITSIVTQVVAALTSAAEANAINTDGATITRRSGDTWTIQITGLGDLSDRAKLWFTVKSNPKHPDSQAVLQVEEGGGLLVIGGAVAGASSSGQIVVDDEVAGDITITLEAVESVKIGPYGSIGYDVQVLRDNGDVDTAKSGRFVIGSHVTHATS